MNNLSCVPVSKSVVRFRDSHLQPDKMLMRSSGVSQPQEWSCCLVWRCSSRHFCTCCQVAAGEQIVVGLVLSFSVFGLHWCRRCVFLCLFLISFWFCWRWAADCSQCTTLHDGWSSWYKQSLLFILRLKMAVSSSGFTARLSWRLGVQSWCLVWTAGGEHSALGRSSVEH